MSKNLGKYTFRLFKRPDFLSGFTAIFDFRKQLEKYNTDETEALADRNSIESDWKAIGDDMRLSLKKHEQQFSR